MGVGLEGRRWFLSYSLKFVMVKIIRIVLELYSLVLFRFIRVGGYR